jgi:hypothetical protein
MGEVPVDAAANGTAAAARSRLASARPMRPDRTSVWILSSRCGNKISGLGEWKDQAATATS